MFWRFTSLVIAVAVFAILAASMLYSPKERASLFEEKKKNADSQLLYEFRRGETIKIGIDPGDDRIHLITHCLLPPHQRYNPHREFVYALKVAFWDHHKQQVHEQVYWEKSGQSKAQPSEGGWRLENSFLPVAEGELTDDRTTVVSVGQLMPAGGELHVSVHKSLYPVLTKIYRIRPRADLERFKRYQTMPDYRKQTLASYMGFDSLEQLSLSDLWMLFQNKWERVEATTLKGEALAKRRIYYHGYRLPKVAGDATLLSIPPGKRLAFNLEGAPSFFVLPVEPDEPTKIDIETVPLAGAAGGRGIAQPLLLEAGTPAEIKFGEQPQTVILNNPGDKPLSLKVAFKETPLSHTGRPYFMPDPTETWASFLIPETVSLQSYAVVPGENGYVEYSALGLRPAELMRIDFRAMLGSAGDRENVRFEVSLIGAKGEFIAQFPIDFTPTPTPFEELYLAGESIRTWLSKPHPIYVATDARVKKVRISSGNHSFVVRGFIEKSEDLATDENYPEPADDVRWRYRKVRSPLWHSVSALDWQRLGEIGRAPTVVAQTRLEWRQTSALGPHFWSSLAVRGKRNLEYLYVQLDSPENPAPLVTSNRGLRLTCAKNREINIDLLPDPASRTLGILEAHYFLPSRIPLRGILSIDQNGKTIANVVPITRRDTIRIRRIKRQGKLRWSHTFKNGDPLVFYKVRPKAGIPYKPPAGCHIVKSFSLVPIPPRRSRTFSVPVGRQQTGGINLVAYSSALPKLETLFDGGKLKRKIGPASGNYTHVRREFLPDWRDDQGLIWMPSRPSQQFKAADTMYIGVGDDLKRGMHSLTVSNKGPQTVWLRAFRASDNSQTESTINVRALK